MGTLGSLAGSKDMVVTTAITATCYRTEQNRKFRCHEWLGEIIVFSVGAVLGIDRNIVTNCPAMAIRNMLLKWQILHISR